MFLKGWCITLADLIAREPGAGSTAQPVEFKLATVVSYDSTNGSTLLFDGESTATTKRYKRLYSYSGAANHRVLVAKVSGTYIILGRVY